MLRVGALLALRTRRVPPARKRCPVAEECVYSKRRTDQYDSGVNEGVPVVEEGISGDMDDGVPVSPEGPLGAREGGGSSIAHPRYLYNLI